MTAPLLQLSAITKRFPGVLALDAVNLEVHAGEIVALIGENGAGKSTLMKIIGGVYQPDSGEVRMDGNPVAMASVSDAMRAGIAFIHQELNVLTNLDVAGNIFLGREPTFCGPLRLIDRKKIAADTNKYLRQLGLDISSNAPLDQLSLAQQQMVEIAKALSLNARVIIMDEPTSSLTLTETERLFGVANDLRARGVSIIYISHRLGEVKHLADRVVALRDGKNAGHLSREEIDHERMVRLMVGRDLLYRQPQVASELQEPRLEVRGLRTRRYPGQPVSFSLRKGEIVGFAGLIGAGRSEIAQTIFGVDPMLGGEIALDGKAIAIHSALDAIERGIYLIPEDRRHSGLITGMNVRENITLPSISHYTTAGWIRRRDEQKTAEHFCHELKIKTPSTETQVATLSGGNQQKIVLAKWLALDPKVLIFDEPTRGIDVGAKAEIYELMRKLSETGVAIMMISSDMEEILGESQRVVVMHEGAIAGLLSHAECTEEKIMRLAVGHKEKAA